MTHFQIFFLFFPFQLFKRFSAEKLARELTGNKQNKKWKWIKFHIYWKQQLSNSNVKILMYIVHLVTSGQFLYFVQLHKMRQLQKNLQTWLMGMIQNCRSPKEIQQKKRRRMKLQKPWLICYLNRISPQYLGDSQ